MRFKALLKDKKQEIIWKIDKDAVLFSNEEPASLSNEFKTIIHASLHEKHAAIKRADNSRVYRLIDLCSGETLIVRKGSLIDLKPLKFYDLENEDQIILGNFSLTYYADMNGDVVESSEELLVERSNVNQIDQTLPPFESEASQDLVPATDELVPAFDTATNEENTGKQSDLEIPSTEDIYSQSHDVVADIHKEINKLISKQELMETQSFSDGISVDVNMKQESPSFQDENLCVETQLCCHVPPSTRSFLKYQKEVKPPTRSLKELNETQAKYENYQLQTQPYMIPKHSNSKQPLANKLEETSLYERRSTQKMNSILMSSSEEEGENSQDSEDKIPKNLTQLSETPSNSPLNMDMLLDTPEDIPRLSSQLLINSDFLERVNCSQPNHDETILEFKAEEEELVSLSSRTSFKRHAQLMSPEMPKKRIKKKCMKYASDEDN